MIDAAATAMRLLATDLAALGAEQVPTAGSTAARDWALSGAMELTGRSDGPPRLAPGGPASWMRAAAALAGVETTLTDPAALLGERAECASLTRNAPRSVGGAFRSLRAADGWLGISLARDSDLDLVPALIEAAVEDDPWTAVEQWLRGRPVAEAAERVRLLGLPAAVVATAPVPPERPAVQVTLGAAMRQRQERPVVVDLSALWAGPLCAHLLGLTGARVIKVETPARPDGARRGPRMFYDLLHGGHESVAVDFANAAGRVALGRMIAWADVVVEGSRPRALQNLGIQAEDYVATGTVWVAISAYGRDHPDRVGFGDDVAAAAGLVADDGDGPYPVGDAIADPLSGVTAAAAAATALRAGRGCLLDVSMHHVAAHAAGLPAEDAAVVHRSDSWEVDTGGEHVPVRPPRARAVRASAPQLGKHTDAVLNTVHRR
jgi:hypothetical protein